MCIDATFLTENVIFSPLDVMPPKMSFSCIKLNLDYFGGQNLNTILSTSLYQLSCNSGCNRLNAKTTVLPFRDDLMLQ